MRILYQTLGGVLSLARFPSLQSLVLSFSHAYLHGKATDAHAQSRSGR
jgi:hypothetical protein